MADINYSNRTEHKLTILFEHTYEFLVCSSEAFHPPHFTSSLKYHHTVETEEVILPWNIVSCPVQSTQEDPKSYSGRD